MTRIYIPVSYGKLTPGSIYIWYFDPGIYNMWELCLFNK